MITGYPILFAHSLASSTLSSAVEPGVIGSPASIAAFLADTAPCVASPIYHQASAFALQ